MKMKLLLNWLGLASSHGCCDSCPEQILLSCDCPLKVRLPRENKGLFGVAGDDAY